MTDFNRSTLTLWETLSEDENTLCKKWIVINKLRFAMCVRAFKLLHLFQDNNYLLGMLGLMFPSKITNKPPLSNLCETF